MATRINTKFVIILTTSLVLLVGGLIFAFTQLKKTAAEHAAIAKSTLEECRAALATGDYKTSNGLALRAASHYYAAKNKDATNVQYLYGFIDAHNLVICSDLTLASNELDSELMAAATIHDTPGSSDKDREFLYKVLQDRVRMLLVVKNNSPLGYLLSYSNKRLESHPEDKIALKYNAYVRAHTAETETSASERIKSLNLINQAIQNSPEDTWSNIALGRYFIGNARRIYRASGNNFNQEVTDNFANAYQALQKSIQLAQENPPALVDATALLLDVRSNDDQIRPKLVGEQINAVISLQAKLEDKTFRDQLYAEELSRVIQLMEIIGVGNAEFRFDARARSLELAQALIKDRPEEPAIHALLARLHRSQGMIQEAEKAATEGLNIQRLTNGKQFLRDQQARVDLLSLQVEIKLILASQEKDEAKQNALIDEAQALLETFNQMSTTRADWRDARSQFLRGRLALTKGLPKEAVLPFEKANQAYEGKDLQTLQFLAETHRMLGNDKLAIEYYEKVIEVAPTSPLRLNLILSYLSQRDGKQLDRAEFHINQYLALFPEDINVIRQQAVLLALQNKTQEAIDLLQKQDLAAHPDLRNDIANFQAQMGNLGQAVEMLRKQIKSRDQSKPISLELVLRLISTIAEKSEKIAEIKRLENEDGLSPRLSTTLQRYVENGALELEDEMALLESQPFEPADLAIRKYQLYQARNMPAEAREQLELASKLSPKLPPVIEARYNLALQDKQWDQAERAIKDMMALPVSERTDVALADGAFMNAKLLAVKAGAMEPGEAQNKRLQDAASAYQSALKQYSHYVDGWITLGRIQIALQNPFAAQSSLREALNRQSNNNEALQLMAAAELQSGNRAAALDRYEELLRLQPTNAEVLETYSNLSRELGVPGRAINVREQLRDKFPSNTQNRRSLATLYTQDRSYTKALNEMQEAIKIEGRTWLNIGTLCEVLVQADQKDRAVQEYTTYLAERGDQADWKDYVTGGLLFQATGQPEESDKYYAKAIALEGDSGNQATMSWGNTLLARGLAANAAALFEQVSAKDPSNDRLKILTSETYLRSGNFEKANAIAKSLPNSVQRYQLLIASASSQGKLPEAIEQARASVKDFPNQYTLGIQLTRLLLAQVIGQPEDKRDFTELQGMVSELVSNQSDRVEVQLLQADVQIASGQIDQAIATLEKLLKTAPMYPVANDRLYNLKINKARSLAQTNREASQSVAKEALAIVSAVIQQREVSPQNYRLAGEAATLAGLTNQAIDFYRTAYTKTKESSDLGLYANALLIAGRGKDARALLEDPANLELIANNVYMRALRGRALASVGESELASNLFKNILGSKNDPDTEYMVVQQAGIAFASDPKRFIDLIDQTMGKNPSILVEQYLTNILISTQNYALAAVRLEKYQQEPVADFGQQFILLSKLALAQQETGRLDEAKANYERAHDIMEKYPDKVPDLEKVHMLNNAAYLLVDKMTGYEQEAVKFAQQAMDLLSGEEPSRNVALIEDTLGWALFKAGQEAEAIRVLQRSVNKYPLVANQLHLGRVYLAKEDKDRALLILESALNQAKSEKDKQAIEEAEKWYRQAL